MKPMLKVWMIGLLTGVLLGGALHEVIMQPPTITRHVIYYGPDPLTNTVLAGR